MKRIKKPLCLILTFLMLVPLTSCASENGEKETLYSGSLESGGRWFFAETSYSNRVDPLEGTYEKKLADSFCINDTLVNGEKRPSFDQGMSLEYGTIVRIEYDGEAYLPSGQTAPIISNVYSVSVVPYPIVIGGVTYLTSCVRNDFDPEIVSELCINGDSRNEYARTPYLLKAESADELRELYLTTRTSYAKENGIDDYDTKLGCYTGEFFEDNVLILALFSSGASGDRFKITSITLTDGIFKIDFEQTQEGNYADGSEWLFCVAVPRSIAKKVNGYEAVRYR